MKKGLQQVFIFNLIFLGISIGINFMLPKFLSIESYASFKTYALYLSYAGLFHFGYNDGMYLKYGGMDLKDIDRKDFSRNFYNYFILELAVSLMVCSFGVVFRDYILVAFAFGMLATNIIGYFKSFYQSIGEFKLYGTSLNLEKLVLFLAYLVMILGLKSDAAALYIWGQILIEFVIAGFLVLYLNRSYPFLRYFKLSFSEIVSNIRNGFILMLGNFANGFFTGIDRWFVKLLMSTASFAAYSFSVTLENMVNVFVTPISITMYNSFAKNPDKNYISRTKSIVLLWGPLIIMAAFPCKWFLEHFMTKYISASNIIFLLFATQQFYVIIKGIYINYYKVVNCQKKYLKQVLIMTAVSICLNVVFYGIFRSMEGIAGATLLTSVIWFLTCEISGKELRCSLKEYVALILYLLSYLLCGVYLNAVMGFIVYILCLMVITSAFCRNNFRMVLSFLKDRD